MRGVLARHQLYKNRHEVIPGGEKKRKRPGMRNSVPTVSMRVAFTLAMVSPRVSPLLDKAPAHHFAAVSALGAGAAA